MNIKHPLKNQIEKYLRMPFIYAVLFLILNFILYFISVKAGIITSIALVLYILVAAFFYFRLKPDIMTNLIGFSFEQGQVQKQLLKELALPYVLLDSEGRILWYNTGFQNVIGNDKMNKKTIFQIFPELTRELFPTDSESSIINLSFQESYYKIEMKRVLVDVNNNEISDSLTGIEDFSDSFIALYLFDETELQSYIQENKDQKLVAGLIYIDNYDEALESIEDVRRSLLLALIDRKINKYMQNIDAIVKKLEKDKFIIVFQQKYLSQLQTNKFSLLDEVRAINIGNELSVTLSISLGVNADNYLTAYEYARVAMDLALGRGGDQAVVKEGEKIIYYGGKTQGVEKNTRVKARVKAHALREILETKDKVVIMGHRIPDVDSLGSALGIYRLAKTLNKKTHIVINEATISIRPVINNFLGNSLYEEDLFIDSEQAIDIVDNNTLLVVVDVNRPSYTECPDLLPLTKSIVVLDHHRQTNETIETAVLSYIEPYASSACEMVAEILQYIVDKPKLKPIEADAMYSGILVDTDNFVTKTGVRTFEACAYLRRSGADVVRVRKMFRNNMDNYKQKVKGVSDSEIYLDSFAISIFDTDHIDSPSVLGAQIANELLDIDGIRASFVFYEIEHQIFISARSIDDVNVQVIMEKLGGGGHANVAGVQLDCSMDEAISMFKEILMQMKVEGDL